MRRKDRESQPRPPASDAGARLEAIVEAAERAAASVIDDAEEQARRYLAEAEAQADRVVSRRLGSLSALTDSLLAQAVALKRQTEGLLAALEEAKAQIDADAGLAPAAAQPLGRPGEEAGRGGHLSAVAPPGQGGPESGAGGSPGPQRGTEAGARLLATQLAVSGSSREEIELRLRNGFEIEDTSSILDAILGPED